MNTVSTAKDRFQVEFEKHKEMLADVKIVGQILDQAFDNQINHTEKHDDHIQKILDKHKDFDLHRTVLFDFIRNNQKINMLDRISQQTRDSILSAIHVFNYVSNEQVHEAASSSEYNHILSLIKKARRSKSNNTDEIQKIYKNNKINAILLINKKIAELERIYYGDYYDNILAVMNSDTPEKEIILQQLYNAHAKKSNKNKEGLLRLIACLKHDAASIENDKLFQVESVIMARSSDRMFIKRVALVIHNPVHLSYSFVFSDIKFPNVFLNCFCQNIPIPDVIDLFMTHKNGNDISHMFIEKYKTKSGIDDIKSTIDSEYLFFPFSHILDEKKEALNEILSCYKKRLPYPATCALLAVIEGILWSFAEFINITSENMFSYNNKGDIVTIINRVNGSHNPNITIGTLLTISCVGEILDKDFIAFYCNDFYDDRNGILHGRIYCDANPKKTAEKMAVLEYITHEINKYIKNFWKRLYQESIPRRYIEHLTTSMQ